jgi:hypothetical protein
MGFLTNLVDNFFGRLQNGLIKEYGRQSNKSGIHPIVAKGIHEAAIKNYVSDENHYLFELKYYEKDLEKVKEIKDRRIKYLIEHWGSEENYKLFKHKIEEDKIQKYIEEKHELNRYNEKIQKEKEEFLKNHNLK